MPAKVSARIPAKKRMKAQPKQETKQDPSPSSKKDTDISTLPDPSNLPTPSLTNPSIKYTYIIGPGETGVLTFEPYKSILLPYWRFRTVAIAKSSSKALFSAFEAYGQKGDFVGMDMTRKFIQMGMTRAKRYANHKGGKKYAVDGSEMEKGLEFEGKREKEMASEVFREVWNRCRRDEGYARLREEWRKSKKEWEAGGGGVVVKQEVKEEED